MLQKLQALRESHLASNHKVTFYGYQKSISDRIIASVLANMALTSESGEDIISQLEPQEITVEISRQAGKTSAIVLTVEFIMIWFPIIFERPISIGIFAPLQSQFKIDFDRLKSALRKTRKDLIEVVKEGKDKAKEEENARTLVLENGARCLVYPVYPTSSPEGETLDLIIIEECQDMTGLREQILTQGIFPMGAATNAPRVFIGTAGVQMCYFYHKIQEANALVLDCDLVIKDRRLVYEQTKNPQHLVYEQYVTSERKRMGEDHDDFKRPFKLVWLLEIGQFITKPQWDSCRINQAYIFGDTTLPHFFGLDTAKEADQTILKIGREMDGRLICVFSMGMRGINYQDQFDIILSKLKNFRIAQGAIDSTGQGDFMPDLFERHSGYKIERFKFTAQSKDILYKEFYNSIVNDKFRYFHDSTEHSNEADREMMALVKEYRQGGNLLSVHHPDGKDAHDDHPDSFALMNFAWVQYNKGSGMADFYKDKLRNVPTLVPKGEFRYGFN